jgi:diacylglycerol kinase family enzyme
MVARLEPGRDYEQLSSPTLSIESRRARLKVALDGELAELATPLVCAVRPGALTVLVPAET